jgi:hypothetical protein
MLLTSTPNAVDWPSWIQAGAAIFAAIGLVWTLILQRKSTTAQIIAVNTQNELAKEQLKEIKAQIEISKRDHQRYLREIKPAINCEIERSNSFEGRVKITIERNPIYDFIILYNRNSKEFIFNGVAQEAPFFNVGTTSYFNYIKMKTNGEVHTINFTLNYKDEIGTEYVQLYWESPNGQLNVEIPVIKTGGSTHILPTIKDIYK